MNLSEFIHIERKDSEKLVACEVTPGHRSKTYIVIWFQKVMITQKEAIMQRTELNVCPACFTKFAYEIQQVGRDLAQV